MTTIRLFMWGYQKHFQVSAKVSAEALFRKLNPEFEAEVFLLGLRERMTRNNIRSASSQKIADSSRRTSHRCGKTPTTATRSIPSEISWA